MQISASIQGKHTVSCWLPEDPIYPLDPAPHSDFNEASSNHWHVTAIQLVVTSCLLPLLTHPSAMHVSNIIMNTVFLSIRQSPHKYPYQYYMNLSAIQSVCWLNQSAHLPISLPQGRSYKCHTQQPSQPVSTITKLFTPFLPSPLSLQFPDWDMFWAGFQLEWRYV